MHHRLQLGFNRLERAREGQMRSLKGVPDAKLAQQPGAGQWSVLQVLNHQMIMERGLAMLVFKKAAKAAELQPLAPGAGLKLSLLKLAFASPIKFRAPDMVANPDNGTTWEAANRDYAEVREFLRQALDAVPPEMLDKAVFKHNAVGWLSLPQTLDMLLAHHQRHARQVNRIRREVGA